MVTMTCDLVERLKTVPDHRRQCLNLKHHLEDILVLGFCGTLAGCDDFVEIADWATDNAEFFRTFLELPNGIPSHDTFRRTFTIVTPATLQVTLLPWGAGASRGTGRLGASRWQDHATYPPRLDRPGGLACR